jgi:hypothetical protein
VNAAYYVPYLFENYSKSEIFSKCDFFSKCLACIVHLAYEVII